MNREKSPTRNRFAASGVRAANQASILQQLRRYQPLSRAEIARRTGLSEGTVSRRVAELIEARLVTEAGAETHTGGRPGTRLQLDAGYLRSIGVELLNWETRVSIGTITGRSLKTKVFRTPAHPREALDCAALHVEALSKEIDPEQLEGVGIVVRGVVDHESGVLKLGNPKGWDGIPIRDILAARLRMPVYVENDVRGAALAEYNSGASDLEGNRCLLFVRVDEGVGVAIVLDGELYRGRHMAAGEFGQMVVASSAGGRETQGRDLESLGSNLALCERYDRLTESSRRLRSGETAARARAMCHAAMQGESAAREALADCCRHLGVGIANLAWILDPDMVIVDGAITGAWQLVLATIMEQLSARELPHLRDLIIRPGALGADAALTGAILLPFRPLFTTGERR